MARLIGGISLSLLLAGIGCGQEAQAGPCALAPPNTTCGLVLVPDGQGYNFIAGQNVAFAYVLSPLKSIYMDNRGPLQTQSLTVSGTDMTNFYLNGSFAGTANINMENGATADLISAGLAGLGNSTNVNITVDRSTLNGATTDFIYDITAGGNKNFTLGSAIFIDLLDLGNHTINVRNGSQLHGSIVTGGDTATVSVDRSSIDNGGIYLAGVSANTISVTNSTVDARNSQVADSLVDLFPNQDLSSIDDLAVGLLGGLQSNTLTLAGSTVTGDVGLLGVGQNSTNEISVINGSRIEGNLVHRGPSLANVNFNDSAIIGDIHADATNTDVVMKNGSFFQGRFLTSAGSTSSLNLIDSTWRMTGNSNVTNLTNDPSVIDFLPPVGNPTLLSSYKTLTVNNYVGEGGQIRLNTFLAGDGSPSDRLVIDGGTATGTTTTVIARNTGGGGAQTTGDGILIVNALNGGTTASGAFAGVGLAGPYEYTLERGNRAGTLPDNWYLRNEVVPSVPGAPALPRFRQEVSLYAAMPVAAAVYGLSVIDTLHERMGGDAQAIGPGDDGSYEGTPDGAWGRLIGHWGHRDGPGIYGGGPSFDYGFGAFQAGLDLYRAESPDGSRDNAGLYAAFGHGEVDVEHNLLGLTFDAGKDKFNAWSVGGYWTHFGPSDWYLDGVVQATWYDTDMAARRNIVGFGDGETDGWGFAASLESGYPFDLGDGWLIEPQAQLVYQAINLNDFSDGTADVRYSDTDSLAGRIGARLARSWDLEEAQGDGPSESGPPEPVRQASVWLRTDLWHEFLGEPTTEFSSAQGFIPFTADLDGSWMKVGLGGTYDFATDASLYGNVNYQRAFDGDTYAWEGKLGVKMTW